MEVMKLLFINGLSLDSNLRNVRVSDGMGWTQKHGWYLHPKIFLAATDKPGKSSGRYFSSQDSTQRSRGIYRTKEQPPPTTGNFSSQVKC